MLVHKESGEGDSLLFPLPCCAPGSHTPFWIRPHPLQIYVANIDRQVERETLHAFFSRLCGG